MKIGIFGGTFNPPHNTHVAMAREAVKQLGLDKLVVMPCGDPPHKRCDVPAKTRLELARLAFGEFAEVSDWEVVQRGKSYTLRTLRHFAEICPKAELYLIVGGDSVRNFGLWYQPKEIAKLCTIAAANRDSLALEEVARNIKRDFGAEIVWLQTESTSLSSTEIRLRYLFGMDNSCYVPAAVDDYVRANGLYCEYGAMVRAVKGYLTPERFLHTYYVVKRGQEISPPELKEKAFVACLLHDVAKYIPKSDYAKYNFCQGDLPDSVVHSFLGSCVARRDFGIEDKDILDAIAYHTTGRPDMTALEKIVYVADKTEDSRPYPKEHLKKGDLNEQFVACLIEAYQVCLERHCDSMSPLSELTVRWYCPETFGLKPLSAEEISKFQYLQGEKK